MPGQHVRTLPPDGVVAQRKAAKAQRFVDDGEAKLLGWVAGTVVMIAAHQRQPEREDTRQDTSRRSAESRCSVGLRLKPERA